SLQRMRRKEPSSAKMETLKINKEIFCQRPAKCKLCGCIWPYQHSKFSRTVYDLKLFKGGIKRWIIRYKGAYYRCRECESSLMPDSYAVRTKGRYGRTLRAYVVYKIIAQNQSTSDVAEHLQELFGYYLQDDQIQRIKEYAAKHYMPTYQQIPDKLRTGELIHADETKITTRTGIGYVWAFANMEEVLYIYADTREGNILNEFLNGFSGVLVSDFYAAYDSVECAQQKCHIHLIRDINDALQRNPFDEELKSLAEEYTKVLSPIIETIDRYGLKKYHLNKHKSQVDKFLKRILDENYRSENAQKFQQRFRKYKEKLFTFLDYDGVPWNNNNAEHMIKRIVKLRRRIKGVTTAKGSKEYLVLLSIYETLRLRNVSFLDFLVSGCLDIDEYVERRR
ncbi:IS66 family transposase, partial [Candidatus Poribacteria bacterium]